MNDVGVEQSGGGSCETCPITHSWDPLFIGYSAAVNFHTSEIKVNSWTTQAKKSEKNMAVPDTEVGKRDGQDEGKRTVLSVTFPRLVRHVFQPRCQERPYLCLTF